MQGDFLYYYIDNQEREEESLIILIEYCALTIAHFIGQVPEEVSAAHRR